MITKDKLNKLQDLYSKHSSYKFNDIELRLIRESLNKSQYLIKYGFYRNESIKGYQIAFIIDQAPHSPRRSGVENKWEIVCTRPISNIEFEEIVENYGTNTRRFIVWYYKDVDYLIFEDQKYKVDTPQEFINECRKRGYSGTFQSSFDFLSA